MQIIGELGKLLVSEIPTQRTEPGYDRPMYTSEAVPLSMLYQALVLISFLPCTGHERTQQIYGEAQTCLHGVKFDSGTNGEATSNQLPVPAQPEFDQSYEYEQDAAQREQEQEQRDSYERAQAYGYTGQLPASESNRLSTGTGQSGTIGTYEKPGSDMPVINEPEPSRSYAPLTTDVQQDGEFSDSVNAGWQAQHDQAGNLDAGQGYAPVTSTIMEQEETPTVSSLHRPATIPDIQHPEGPTASGAVQPGDGPDYASLDVPKDPSPALEIEQGQSLGRGQPLSVDTTANQLQPSASTQSGLVDGDVASVRTAGYTDTNLTPSGDDLSGTGLYGNQTESPTTETTPTAYNPPNPATAAPAYDGRYDTSNVVMAPVLSDQPAVQPIPRQVSNSSFAPPPGRPSGPAQSRAPPTSSSMQQLPFPGAGQTLGSSAAPVSLSSSTSKRQSLPPAPLQQASYRSTSSSKTPPPASAPTSPNPNPSSPTRTKPTRQTSSQRESRQGLAKRQDSSDYAQRSSIAYLNDVPHIAPPMRAPPPVTSLGPLPSTSPYFNSYATLRSSSYGKPEPSPSLSASASESASRPRTGSRSNSNSLGNKLGYDKKQSHSSQEKPLLQMPQANSGPSTSSNRDYTYAINDPGTGTGGRKLNAGAFRRNQPQRESSYLSTQSTGTDGTVSPAQRLRDEWRNSQAVPLTPSIAETQSNYATPQSTPAIEQANPSIEQLAENERGHPQYRESLDMYGDRAQSSQQYLHRTSAVDAPTDVLPSDNYSHTSLNRLAEEGRDEEAVLPLNVRKRSVVSEMPDAPAYDGSQQGSQDTTIPGGFNGMKYVTNLE